MKKRFTRARHACAMAIALWAAAAAGAASPVAPGEALTLTRAIELAATHSPSIAALTSETEALAARSEAEALPPSIHIESEFENFAGSGDASGTDLLESTVRLSRVVEFGNKAALRRGLGSAELDRLAAEQQLARCRAVGGSGAQVHPCAFRSDDARHREACDRVGADRARCSSASE